MMKFFSILLNLIAEFHPKIVEISGIPATIHSVRQDLLSRAPEPPARWQCGLPLPAFFLALLSPCALARDGGLGATGSLGQWALRPFPCEAIGQPSHSDEPCFRTLLPFGYSTLVRRSRGIFWRPSRRHLVALQSSMLLRL